MNQVQKLAERSDDASAILQLILNPEISQERLQFLIDVRKQMLDRQAELAYSQARADMAEKMPIIEKKGKMDRGTGKAIPYGLWEDVNAQIAPVMTKYGFFLEFKTDSKTIAGHIEVTCFLRHASGHHEQTSLDAAPDTSGSKNPIQAQISTVTYLKRHTAGALLNLSYRGEDDDAVVGGGGARITEEQITAIEDAIEKAKVNRAGFLKFYKLKEVSDLAANLYDSALQEIRLAGERRAKASKAKGGK